MIFDQLREYSDHLDKFGANRLRDMLSTLSIAQRDDLNQLSRGNIEETGTMHQTEEALDELREAQEKVSRVLTKSKKFFAE